MHAHAGGASGAWRAASSGADEASTRPQQPQYQLAGVGRAPSAADGASSTPSVAPQRGQRGRVDPWDRTGSRGSVSREGSVTRGKMGRHPPAPQAAACTPYATHSPRSAPTGVAVVGVPATLVPVETRALPVGTRTPTGAALATPLIVDLTTRG